VKHFGARDNYIEKEERELACTNRFKVLWAGIEAKQVLIAKTKGSEENEDVLS